MLGKVAAQRKLSECPGEQAGEHAGHSQLVDGVLRDDRVGREVGDHVGATKTAGAGGGRLPFPGQRAQDHRTGSEFTGPFPGFRLAPNEKLSWGLGAEDTGSGFPAAEGASRVARRQPPQPWGSAVDSRRLGAASNPPSPVSGAGRCVGRVWWERGEGLRGRRVVGQCSAPGLQAPSDCSLDLTMSKNPMAGLEL